MPYHSAIHFCDDVLLVWLLISKVLNAAIVTSVIAQTSLRVSFLITIFGSMGYSLLFPSGERPSSPATMERS